MNKNNKNQNTKKTALATRIFCLVLAALMVLGGLTTLFVYLLQR